MAKERCITSSLYLIMVVDRKQNYEFSEYFKWKKTANIQTNKTNKKPPNQPSIDGATIAI